MIKPLRLASLFLVLSCATITCAQQDAADPDVDTKLAAAFNQEELMDMLAAEQLAESEDAPAVNEVTPDQAAPARPRPPVGGAPVSGLNQAEDTDDSEVFCVKNGLQYAAGDEWSTGCETCMCQESRGRGNVICFQKKVCTKVRCPDTQRLVSRPEVDPCCDVCVPIEELCPECPVDDTANAKPICGSDGVTYPSMCMLTRNNCLDTKKVRVANYGGGCDEVDAALKEAAADLGATSSSPATTTPDSGSSTGEILLIVGLIGLLVCVVCACVLGGVAFIVVRRRRARKAASLNPRASFYDAGQQPYTDESAMSTMPTNESILMQSRLRMMPTIASVGGAYDDPEPLSHHDSDLYKDSIQEDAIEGTTFETSGDGGGGGTSGTSEYYTNRESPSPNGTGNGQRVVRSSTPQKKVVIRKASKKAPSPPATSDTEKYGD